MKLKFALLLFTLVCTALHAQTAVLTLSTGAIVDLAPFGVEQVYFTGHTVRNYNADSAFEVTAGLCPRL